MGNISKAAESTEYSVATWEELKRVIEEEPGNLTIVLTENLAADSTITIPSDKSVTISGDKSIYRLKDTSGFLSMFHVSNNSSLVIDNGIVLSGEEAPIEVKLQEVSYDMYQYDNLTGKRYILRNKNKQEIITATQDSEDIERDTNPNIKFDNTYMDKSLLTNSIFAAKIYGYLTVEKNSNNKKFYYQLRNEATGRSLAIRNKTAFRGALFDSFLVDDAEVKRFEDYIVAAGQKRGSVAFTFARWKTDNYSLDEKEIVYAVNDGRITGEASAERNINEHGVGTRNYRYMRWSDLYNRYIAYNHNNLDQHTEDTPQLYEVVDDRVGQPFSHAYTKAELGNPSEGGFFIHNDGGTVTINGATLQDFTTVQSGDTVSNISPVYNENNATFYMHSGTIQNNEVGYHIQKGPMPEELSTKPGREINSYISGSYPNNCAGAIIFKNSTGVLDGTAQLIHNKGDVGGIYCDSSFVTLSDKAKVDSNNGILLAGAIYITGNKVGNPAHQDGVVVKGGEISNSHTWRNGAVTTKGPANEVGGRFTLNEGTLHDNSSYDKGGAIRVASNGVSLNGGELYNNKSRVMGGAIYVEGDNARNSRTLVINDGSIYHNQAVGLNAEELGGDTDVYFPKGKPDSRVGYLQSGTGGGIWVCPFGTFSFDASRVMITDNTAERERGGNDLHKDNGLSGAIVIKNIGIYWKNEDNEPIPDYAAEPYEGVVNMTNTNKSMNHQKGVRIHDNISRRGGGIGADGTLILGTKTKESKQQAFLSFTKEWDQDIPDEPIFLKFTLQASDGFKTELGITKLTKDETPTEVYDDLEVFK
ncbi:hypothetical protein [Granulicatella balaenopterae]|uniref:hypothetical protein n=1 Tax=Granulicatella balaenopterae TaxID=137733 RepID=UPI00115FFD61|nr:hypothetical protein [Granulicatella balaenopterae]